MKKTYNLNKTKKVGETCVCPSCGTNFIKETYQQTFCKTKGGSICKDKYWNTVTPTKRNNTTRISPASKRYISKQIEERGSVNPRYTSEGYEIIHGVAHNEWGEPIYNVDDIDDDHPFSTDGLGQW